MDHFYFLVVRSLISSTFSFTIQIFKGTNFSCMSYFVWISSAWHIIFLVFNFNHLLHLLSFLLNSHIFSNIFFIHKHKLFPSLPFLINFSLVTFWRKTVVCMKSVFKIDWGWQYEIGIGLIIKTQKILAWKCVLCNG